MKKLFTLFIAAATFITADAQSTREEARKVVLGGGNSDNRGGRGNTDIITERNESGRQAEIAAINNEYNQRIQEIRNNPNLSQEEKQRAISRLNKERAERIREVNRRYNVSDDRDRDNREKKAKKDKKAKSNNGKHLGWEKGVGNPHKNGGKPKGKNRG